MLIKAGDVSNLSPQNPNDRLRELPLALRLAVADHTEKRHQNKSQAASESQQLKEAV